MQGEQMQLEMGMQQQANQMMQQQAMQEQMMQEQMMQEPGTGQGYNPFAGGISASEVMPQEDVLREEVMAQDFAGAANMPPEI
jgi:hypothetical protein